MHRLDRETSGLILVAKNDASHRNLGSQFARREVKKLPGIGPRMAQKETATSSTCRYVAIVIRRNRMTTRGFAGRDAITHYKVEAPH